MSTSGAAPSPAALAELLDKQAIAEVLYRYCRGCDRADEQALRSCFHVDCQLRHGGFSGSATDFCTLAMKIVTPLKACKHLLTNVLIQIDGDVALCESHYLAYHREVHRRRGEEEDHISGGRYLDRFERRNGEWRIAQRVGLIDFERYQPPADRHLEGMPAEQRSGKFPDDELYRHFMIPPER
jgi:hypothetical protein